MPHVDISLYAGRTPELKEEFASKIQKAMIDELGFGAPHVSVSLTDTDPETFTDDVMKKIDPQNVIIESELIKRDYQAAEPSRFIELSRKRFAVRAFSDKPLEQEKLDIILEAGNTAPTAKNQQPHRIYVLQSPEALAKLDQLTDCRYNAPTVLMVTYHEDEIWVNPDEAGINSGVEDATIVATHMILQAAELGVDSTWVNAFTNSELIKAFGLSDKEHVVMTMNLGYGVEGTEPFPNHTNKKALADIVTYL